jgi:hypothetical protein
MSRLELAADRLARALELLEKAAESERAPANGGDATHSRIAALESERQTLLARIAALEEELTVLSGMTEEVEGRLDGAIGEIRAALARS